MPIHSNKDYLDKPTIVLKSAKKDEKPSERFSKLNLYIPKENINNRSKLYEKINHFSTQMNYTFKYNKAQLNQCESKLPNNIPHCIIPVYYHINNPSSKLNHKNGHSINNRIFSRTNGFSLIKSPNNKYWNQNNHYSEEAKNKARKSPEIHSENYNEEETNECNPNCTMYTNALLVRLLIEFKSLYRIDNKKIKKFMDISDIDLYLLSVNVDDLYVSLETICKNSFLLFDINIRISEKILNFYC